jgi:hypothetical protein
VGERRVFEGVIMKPKLVGLAMTAVAAILTPGVANAVPITDFDFSFTNTEGEVAGTVTGVIEVPSSCTGCAATAVIINTIPAGDPALTLPLDTTTAWTVNVNMFTVSGGVLTAINYNAFVDNTYGLSLAPQGVAQTFYGDLIDTSTDLEDEGPLVFPSATPLPTALPLFTTGLGAMGLFGWRRKRKAAAIAA